MNEGFIRNIAWRFILILFVQGWALALHANISLKAEEHFKAGEYEKALEIWYGEAASGLMDDGLYFNIGLAEYKLGDHANAMIALEKARRLKPGNRRVRQLLQEIRNESIGMVIPVKPFFLGRWYRWCITLFRPGEWAIIGLVILGAVSFIWAQRFLQKPLIRKWDSLVLRNAVIAGLILLALSGLSALEIYRQNEAILFSACDLKEGPDELSPSRRQVVEGEKLKLEDRIGNWYKVELMNTESGWIRDTCFQRLQF